jgi:hypothetical protein
MAKGTEPGFEMVGVDDEEESHHAPAQATSHRDGAGKAAAACIHNLTGQAHSPTKRNRPNTTGKCKTTPPGVDLGPA